MASISCSRVTYPGRRSTGVSSANEIMVDSTPTEHGPPSIIASTLPIRSCTQCSKVVGLGLPERFADGAARGKPDFSIIFCATGCDGKRTATVGRFALVTSGILSLFFIIMVKGPGQNFSARIFAFSGTSSTTSLIISMLQI